MASIIRTDSIQNLNTSNIITQTNATTLTLGYSGQTIAVASGATLLGGGITWTSTVVTSAMTVAVNTGYFVNTSSNAITVTLPASASVGNTIILTDFNRTFATNNLTLNPNSLNFQGNTSPNPIYNTDGQTVQLVYSGATQGWIPTSDDDVTLETPQSYSVDFLVIAGGGAGAYGYGGGGGAGGYRTSTQSVVKGTAITVTVGDGGAGSGGPGAVGSNSSISGTGLTTITSAGGGGGGQDNNGSNGGSGGGGGGAGSPTSGGSGNTPSTSPSQGNNGGTGASAPNYGGGGGGGAGAVGVNGTGTVAGNGGAGTASSITGSSVTRAGGGGGGTYQGGTAGSGGTGGGGDAGSAGTANTGGGGGAGIFPNNGLSGGKGVVILSLPIANYSNTTTGSPTVTESGSNKILVFNGSGSYTA
jgi:hypothetical protein